jgi:putative heme-binding domain-containing protein
LSPAQRVVFLTSKFPAIQERAARLFPAAPANRQKALADAKAALALPANAPRGREIFRSLCATCHRLDREGHAVGPDLFDIRNQPKENILFHIVAPDAEIAPAFAGYTAETRDGRTLTGVLSSETPTSLTLRMPLGEEANILRKELSSLTAIPGSLMPVGLDSAMSLQELADLLGYLKGEQ